MRETTQDFPPSEERDAFPPPLPSRASDRPTGDSSVRRRQAFPGLLGRPALAPSTRRSPQAREWTVFGVLLLATLLSTALRAGPAYAGWLLGILFCHEMGHYLTARHYRVRTSLPFFLPFPLSPFGTFGALILLRQRIRTRRILFDIGIAGPLAGILPSLAATVWGLAHSRVIDPSGFRPEASLHLGSSLLFAGVERIYFPHLGPGEDVLLHPVAFAGWAGLFVTSLNLLPVGQLDGGHILYGILGPRARQASWIIAGGIALAGIWYPGWWVLLVFLLVTRLRHPSTDDESVPLGRGRVLLGVFALLFFVLTFIPQPLRFP